MSLGSRESMRIVAAVVAGILILAGCNWRGPAPTQEALDAPAGPFSTASSAVTSSPGFGDGTIYYPDTEAGPFAMVAMAPGWTANQTRLAVLAERIASHGFVVISIDVNNSFLDFPDSRGDQLLAALDHMPSEPAVADIVDPERQAVMGHSMGGGGSLHAALDRPELAAAIPLAPWETSADFSAVAVPTMVIACESDGVAPVSSHALPFYESIGASVPKAFVEIAGAPHDCVTASNTDEVETAEIASSAIAFLKRFADGDTRYDQFLCPVPVIETPLSDRQANCDY